MPKRTLRGGATLGPLPPVMVSCGDADESNIITIGWTGILNTVPPKTYISVRPSRHSYEIIKRTGEFVINLTPSSLVKSADFCGIYTGKKVNKFERCGLTREQATQLSCPMIAECPLSIECRVTDIVPLGSHDMFVADIVAVNVAEELFDSDGKYHLERAGLVAYAHGEYYELGKRLGAIGFSTDKKKKHVKNKNSNKRSEKRKED